VKLIAEPWDLGEGGYQVGNFPIGWTEWNGKYRDTVRDYWRGEGRVLSDLASRLTGSSDLYQSDGRRPYASINFVTAHDGFTLQDLVSYNEKHNEANKEENRDGESHNRSWNCGVEGPTDDPQILALRARQKRNFLATLLLSQGVPMLLAGDELGRTQHGNNNAYCQDSKISWVEWHLDEESLELQRFVRELIHLRRDHPGFRRRCFFSGVHGEDRLKDIYWLNMSGKEMTDEQWHKSCGCLGIAIPGSGLTEKDGHGEPVQDDDFLLLLNTHHEEHEFVIPQLQGIDEWLPLLDTSHDSTHGLNTFRTGDSYPLQPRSLALLLHPRNHR
jgi:glycogen operon protein